MSDAKWERRRATFDEDVDNYELARPEYPSRVYHVLTRRCGLVPGARVLEVGPGTGQATRHLLGHGARVVAVELGAALAARLRRNLAGSGLNVIEGDFTEVELPAGTFDLAVCATALHWLDAATAIPRFGRLLRPGGWLAVWWTVFGDPRANPPWRYELDNLFLRCLPHERRDPAEIPEPLRVEARTAEIGAGGWFGPTQVEIIPWEYELTPVAARRLFATFPGIRLAPAPQREAFLDALGELVAGQPGGVVTDHYVTALYLAQRSRAERS